MKKHLNNLLKLIVFLSLGVFFIWLSIKDLTPEDKQNILNDVRAVFTEFHWIYLILGMILGLISVYLRGLRAIMLIEPLGYKVSKSNAYHSVMICYMANVAIPRLGEILRCTYLQRYEKVPFQKSLGTVITERAVDCFLMIPLFILAIVVEADKLIPLLGLENIGEKISGYSFVKWLIIFLIIVIIVLLFLILKRLFGQNKIFKKIKEILTGFWRGIISIAKVRRPGLFVFYSVLIWICWYFMFMVGSFAFPEMLNMGNSIWAASLSCVIIGTLGFIVAQGGLGAYPLLISSVLLLYGIKYETGLAIGWVIWANETFVYVAGGLITLIFMAFKKEPKNESFTDDKK